MSSAGGTHELLVQCGSPEAVGNGADHAVVGSAVNPFINNNMETVGSQQKLTFEDGVGHKKPSRTYLYIIILLGVAVVALVIPLVIISLDRSELSSEVGELKKDKLCTSEQCVKSASTYLASMNSDAVPCDNFFEYACGGWVKTKVIPEDKSSYSAFSILREEVAVVCKGLFEREGTADDPKSIVGVRNYYQACLDVDRINEKGSEPLIDLLKAIGGWPVLGSLEGGNWNQSTYHYDTFWALLTGRYGSDLVISSWVGADDKNSSGYIMKIDQPSLGLGDRDYYREPEFKKERDAYVQYMVDVVVELGQDAATARTAMEQVMTFETAIANMSIAKDERRDNEALYNIYTLDDLIVSYPELDWVLMFDLLMPASVKPIKSTERIINKVPQFMGNLTQWLITQDDRVVANYMVWRLVKDMVSHLGQSFVDIRLKFQNVLSGTSSTPARWDMCVDETNQVLEFATGRLYVEENFPGNAKQKTMDMINNLMIAFKAMLETNEWLQEEDKVEAAAKADAMRIDVGYPDWIMDDAKLDEEYDGLDFVADGYFNNVLLYRAWYAEKNLLVLRELVDRTAWTAGPAVVNAFFSATKNRILFPAGILQPPFYHQDLPWYSNYGGIGVVIGHEITHGFDDEGRQYDKDGNLVDWWSEQSVTNFKERAQCIIDQYDAFVMPETGENLNGKQTQGENIADNGGLKESYKAYKDNIGEELMLPGLDFDADQLFFLTFGQIWCSAFRPEGVTSQILNGVHSPGRYRVIGPMQNNADFARAFNCPSPSYMNPTDKCSVW